MKTPNKRDVYVAGRPWPLRSVIYILTVTEDGGVPVYFTSASGNTTDDTTHRQTWDLLHELTGRSDFLYVADCKLASSENMNYIARKQGRFITVLPRTRKEDQQFRQRLLKTPDAVDWKELYVQTKDRICKGKVIKEVTDRVSVCSQDLLSEEGYRLFWYHSTRKAHHDAHRRIGRVQRATRELTELRDRLRGPKTRFGERKTGEGQNAFDESTALVSTKLLSTKVPVPLLCIQRRAQRRKGTDHARYIDQRLPEVERFR